MLKGSLPQYLAAIEDEIERVKHQKACVPEFRESSHKSYDEYLQYLEDMKVEACLLMDFENPDVTGVEDEVAEAHLLCDEIIVGAEDE